MQNYVFGHIYTLCLNCCYPSTHKTFVQHLYNVGPTSSTLVQHCTNAIQIFVFAGYLRSWRVTHVLACEINHFVEPLFSITWHYCTFYRRIMSVLSPVIGSHAEVSVTRSIKLFKKTWKLFRSLWAFISLCGISIGQSAPKCWDLMTWMRTFFVCLNNKIMR